MRLHGWKGFESSGLRLKPGDLRRVLANPPCNPDGMTPTAEWKSSRDRTAISRNGLSAPTRQALQDGIITGQESLLDYGAGRGQDSQRLAQIGVDATALARISTMA